MPAGSIRELSDDFLLFTHAPSRFQTRVAALAAVLVTLTFAAILPFRNVPLARVNSFIPVVDSVLVLGDLLTAVLLFTQAATLSSRALLALAGGYLFTGLIIVPHALSFPGGFSPTGLLGGGPSTTVWLNVAWHMGLPAAAIAYTFLRRADERVPLAPAQVGPAITGCVVVSAVLVLALTTLATLGAPLLPQLMRDSVEWIPERLAVVALMPAVLSVAALAALLRHRRSLIDLWLLLVIWGWLLETLIAMVSTSRFSIGWYTGRIAALLSGVLVLVMLLVEITRLYGRLALLVTVRNREREGRSLTLNAVTAAMAHEIKQPLACIVANAGTGTVSLRRSPVDLKLIGELFESIENEGTGAGRVLDSIRSMFLHHPTRRERLDMNELVHKALELIRAEADASRVVLNVQRESRPLLLTGDDLQLKHVLLNVLVNAIEAMKPVTDRPRLLQVSTRERDGEVLVTISDNGVGFTDGQAERLFEAFYSTKHDGTGMGLPLCRSIVEAHGGRIVASAGKPCGAAFAISLPGAA